MDMKPWYQSKTVLASIGIVLLSAYQQAAVTGGQHGLNIHPLPPETVAYLNTLLSGIIAHGRITANTQIGSVKVASPGVSK